MCVEFQHSYTTSLPQFALRYHPIISKLKDMCYSIPRLSRKKHDGHSHEDQILHLEA